MPIDPILAQSGGRFFENLQGRSPALQKNQLRNLQIQGAQQSLDANQLKIQRNQMRTDIYNKLAPQYGDKTSELFEAMVPKLYGIGDTEGAGLSAKMAMNIKKLRDDGLKTKAQVEQEVSLAQRKRVKSPEEMAQQKKGKKFAKGALYLVDGKLAQSRWNPEGFNELQDKQGNYAPAETLGVLAKSTTNLEIGADGSISFKTGISDQTIKTQSAHEREVDQGEELALEAKNIFNNLRSEDVGFRGVFGEVVIDKMLGQVFDSVVNKDRIKNRASMRALREKGLRFMTTDTRFNQADRDAVEKLFPSDGVFESLPAARATLTMFGELISDRVSKSAGRLGRKPLTEMTSDEIIQAVRDKQLNLGTAKRALMLFHGFSE